MATKKKWTDCAIAAKAEWEGTDYIVTDVDPDEVEDQELADWIRVAKVAFIQVADRLNQMAEACEGPGCELCGEPDVEDVDDDDIEEIDEDEDDDDIDFCAYCEEDLDENSFCDTKGCPGSGD